MRGPANGNSHCVSHLTWLQRGNEPKGHAALALIPWQRRGCRRRQARRVGAATRDALNLALSHILVFTLA